MRAYVPSYQLISPANLYEALDLLAQYNGVWKPFAGGTDLMVLLEAGKLPHQNYVNIWNLKELRGIEVTANRMTLGALTTYTEVQEHPILQKEFPMLCQAARETGGIAIQNRGTLGGNIVNASPAADSPPALLAYDAQLELVSKEGERIIPYSKFHSGYKQMDIRPNELLSAIRLPRVPGDRLHYYRKVGTRKAQAISKVCFAGIAQVNENRLKQVRIALGSVAPIPFRCERTEVSLVNQSLNDERIELAASVLAAEIAPIDDIRSTRDYRLRVSLNLLRDFLSQAARAV
ncbi:MAG TPA: xanthine dehydrogenase family protein subunit M [Pyrinomonadaceae bacterium]|nr:xanthine dehydrogenase family protein subunit M [Pyrinomonadaceae bacterium]